VRDPQAVRDVIRRPVIPRHRGPGRPGEIVVQQLPQPIIAGQADVDECLIKTRDCAAVHFLVWTVAAVYPHDCRLVTKGGRVARRTAQRLAPIRRQPLGVVGTKPVTERVADHLVVHDPRMPGARQAKQARGTAGRLEYRLHAQRSHGIPSRPKRIGLARPRVSVLP
jgi:hypothetical protein